jgi:hypothetical protein
MQPFHQVHSSQTDAEVHIYGGNTFSGLDMYATQGTQVPRLHPLPVRGKERLEGFMTLLNGPDHQLVR